MDMDLSFGGAPRNAYPALLLRAIASLRVRMGIEVFALARTWSAGRPCSIRSLTGTSLTWNTPRAPSTVFASDTIHTLSGGTASTCGHACCVLRVIVALHTSGAPPWLRYIIPSG